MAVGYFILDTLRSLYLTGVNPDEPVRLKVGLISPEELDAAVTDNETHVFLPPIAAIQDLGELYKLIVMVSRGDESSA